MRAAETWPSVRESRAAIDSTAAPFGLTRLILTKRKFSGIGRRKRTAVTMDPRASCPRDLKNVSRSSSSKPSGPSMQTTASSTSSATPKSPWGLRAKRLPPTVAAERTPGPPIDLATGARKASAGVLAIVAIVTPAPSRTVLSATWICLSSGVSRRTYVLIEISPSFTRLTRIVPPPKSHASRRSARKRDAACGSLKV